MHKYSTSIAGLAFAAVLSLSACSSGGPTVDDTNEDAASVPGLSLIHISEPTRQ